MSSRSTSSAAVMVELYENEVFKNNEWQSYTKMPWVSALDNGPCTPRDEYETLGEEWRWTCNWKVKYKQTMEVDIDGWEYASKIERLYSGGSRVPRGEAKWSDKARRRLWYRLMKREVKKAIEIKKAIPRIQENLSSVHDTRVKIEGLISKSPKNAQSPELQDLVEKVKMNIYDLLDALDQLDETNTNKDAIENKRYIAVLKKLRNDCLREEDALLKAAGRSDKRGNIGSQRGTVSGTGRATGSAKRGSGRSLKQPSSSEVEDQSPSVSSRRASRSSFVSIGSSGKGNKKGELNIQAIDRDIIDYSSIQGDSRSQGSGGDIDDSLSSNATSRSHSFKGDFIPRDTNEMIIDQKLIPVDEATLMQELIDERAQQIEAMNKGIVEVRETFLDLGNMVRQQSVDIQSIFENTEESAEKTKAGLESIKKAEKLQHGTCTIT